MLNLASSQENLSSGFPTKWDSNPPAQLQRLARKLKFRSLQLYTRQFPIIEWQRRWSDWADAQAGQRLCYSQTSEDRFSCIEAHLEAFALRSLTLECNFFPINFRGWPSAKRKAKEEKRAKETPTPYIPGLTFIATRTRRRWRWPWQYANCSTAREPDI